MKTFSFEKLIVWQKALELSEFIYGLTQNFPKEEKFGLTSQMRHCSVSISSNISEGSGRNSSKDKARFTVIAYGSALELMNQVILSNKLDFISKDDCTKLRADIAEITAMLNALHKSQLKKQ